MVMVGGRPLTGASSMARPRSEQAVDTRRATSGSLVVVSTSTAPPAMADSTPASLPSSTDSTWAGPGSEVQTTSQPTTAASELSAHIAPR